MLFKKNEEKKNSDMFKNALIKERYSQKKKESFHEKNRNISQNSNNLNLNQPNKSIFSQVEPKKQYEIKIDEKILDEKIKTHT